MPPENPKTSGSQATVERLPNQACEGALPVEELADERLAAGDLQSGSTHEPPIGSQRPSATRSLTRAKRSGASSSIQA